MQLPAFCRRKSPKVKLPPVERAMRKVFLWKNIQTAALAINVIVMAGIAGYITSEGVGVAGGIVVPIIMSGVALILTGLGNWFGRYLAGYRHRWYLVMLILADTACIGTQIAAFIVLTVAKVPAHCTGLTPISSRPDDPRNTPAPGYDTIGFGQPNEDGELDNVCAGPRLSWLISLLLMTSYIHTIGWAIRLIVALKRRHNHEGEVESQPRDAPPAAPVSRYHVNVPIAPRSNVDSDTVEPSYSQASDVPAPATSPPPYSDEGIGVFTHDKKQRLRERI